MIDNPPPLVEWIEVGPFDILRRRGSSSQKDFALFHAERPGVLVVADSALYPLGQVYDRTTGKTKQLPEGTARQDGLRVVDLPVPCTVAVDGVSYDVADGSADLADWLPGSYVLVVTSPRTRRQTLEVVVP